uniref:Regulatory protein zeste n=1 Tax=Haemonchus contortus TaxID=6289 RepID=A0A7I4YYB1_HAECO
MGSASSGVDNSKRKKGVNWTVQENELVIELFLTNYDMYYFKFSDGSKRGSKALRDSLHERWAEQLTRLGFAERTSQQVAEKLKKSIILTRKFINNNNNNGESTSKPEELPAYLRPLEKKLREEYAKKAKGDNDPPNENTALRFCDLLKDVKEESESSPGAKDTSDTHSLDVDLDIEPSTSLYESPMSRLSRMANLPQSLDPPIAPVTPIKNNLLLPSVNDNSKKRATDEELEDMNAKRQRLLNAELELVERKRYLVEMKIKYWEEKTKRLSST